MTGGSARFPKADHAMESKEGGIVINRDNAGIKGQINNECIDIPLSEGLKRVTPENNSLNLMKTVYVILCNGFEEIEAITPIDLLRRAGANVVLISTEQSLEITGRSDIKICADRNLENLDAAIVADVLLLPGGPGHKTLRTDSRVIELVKAHNSEGKFIAAICAAPVILKEAGVIPERYTAHFSVTEELPVIRESEAVCTDGNIITSRGAGTAVKFGLAIVEALYDTSIAKKIADSIHYA